jgi:hypothetical protein
MDPLSSMANISQLADLTALIFIDLFNYCRAVKQAPKCAVELRNELQNVSCLLDQIKEHFNDGSQALVSRHVLESMKQCTQEFEKLLQAMGDRIRREKTQGFQRLIWPFSSSENREFLARIERYKTIFNLALSIKQR